MQRFDYGARDAGRGASVRAAAGRARGQRLADRDGAGTGSAAQTRCRCSTPRPSMPGRSRRRACRTACRWGCTARSSPPERRAAAGMFQAAAAIMTSMAASTRAARAGHHGRMSNRPGRRRRAGSPRLAQLPSSSSRDRQYRDRGAARPALPATKRAVRSSHFVYSQFIGLSILLLIAVPRLTLWPRAMPGRPWQVGAASAIAGDHLGFVGRQRLAPRCCSAAVAAVPAARRPGDVLRRLVALITILASVGCSSFFWMRERVVRPAARGVARTRLAGGRARRGPRRRRARPPRRS